MTYIVTAIILAGGLFLYLRSYGNTPTINKVQTTALQDTIKPKLVQTKENKFEKLRNMCFSVTPEQLQLLLPTNSTIVYGVIMDWAMDGATATIVSYTTGDASMYLSSGGGIIGGIRYEQVNKAAKQFVNVAQQYINKASKTENTDQPLTNQVKFYLLTNKGKFVAQDNMKNFENNSSEWQKLFEEGNKVLTELRKTTKRE